MVGESFAGHMIPQIAARIARANRGLAGLTPTLTLTLNPNPNQVVDQHREMQNPQRNWKTAGYQLVSLAVLVGTLLHFTGHDMLSNR